MKFFKYGLFLVLTMGCASILKPVMINSGFHNQLLDAAMLINNKDIFELVKNISAYRQVTKNWPTKRESLIEIDMAIDSVENLNNFKELIFIPFSDSLEVNYLLDYSEPKDDVKRIVGSLIMFKSDTAIRFKMNSPAKIERVSR